MVLFPEEWKVAELFLPKPEKKYLTDPSAYRPLCHLTAMSKLAEKIIV